MELGTINNWYIFVNEQVYGPFTSDVMLGFVTEGRVISNSFISRQATKGFLPASHYEDYEAWSKGQLPKTKPNQQAAARRQTHTKKATPFIIMGEISSSSMVDFLQALQSFGNVQRIGDALWALNSAYSLEQIRSELTPVLSKRDRLFIQDCKNDKQGWANLGADLEGRLQNIWN